MRQILSFLKHQKDFFLFIFLFFIAFSLVFNANSFQKTRYLHAANRLSGNLYLLTNSVTKYFGLHHQNELLAQENKKLRQQLLDTQKDKINAVDTDTNISFSPNTYEVFRAEVIRNSINLTKNFILINKGTADSINQDMGVISSKGIVGIVDKSTLRFSSVQSVLNVRSKISAALKKSGHYGTLTWDEQKLNIVQLVEVPNIAPVKVGDTIVTDGRSMIFPKGIPVGKVKAFRVNPLDNTYVLDVELFTDMSNIQHIYIIKNEDKSSIEMLQNQIQEVVNE